MKVGFVGCGSNSDYHINFAKDYNNLEIVGIVDKNKKMARECSEKFGITKTFSTIRELVDYQQPDVIHIVTPPKTHYLLAKEAIQSGCNVLVEKPLTLNFQEACELYDLAEQEGVKLCAMHNHFFDPCMLQAREFIASGQIGDIINVESYYGMNTRIDAFRKYPAPNVLPWLYDLPGGVYQDFMAHPLYVLLPFIGNVENIELQEKSFGELPQNLSDELRIVIKGEKAFGVVTISFTAKPLEHFIKIYGTKAVIKVNVDTMTTTIHKLSRLPKAAQKATLNLSESWQLFKSTVANIWNFGRGRLRPYHGMKTLIHRFYDAVDGKEVIPVSREEALNVIETMDKLWPYIQNKHLKFNSVTVDDSSPDLKVRPRVLITGATGFLGSRLVEVLVQRGYRVRALARKLSHIEKLKNLQTEIFFGDVSDADSLKPAFKDVDVVVHAAADTAGTEEGGQLSTLLGTSNILDLCKETQVKKLLYISSCSVYGVADYKKNEVVTELSPLERFPEKRGHYSNAKMKAEQLVADAMKKDELPVVCLRPGTIFGLGGEIYTPMMGFSLGTRMFIIIGNDEFRLPLVYIDNLIEAIVAAIEKDQSGSQIYNVVDPDNVTKKEYVELLLKKLYPDARYFYFPYSMLYATVFFQEILTRMLRRPPFLTRYRLISSQKNIRYDSSKIQKDIGWGPSCSTKDAFEKIIQFEKGKRV
jgi:nucleoside-diphosphate-sugar epimerase/predicted dehydrogenase